MFISLDLRFHLQDIDSPVEAWAKLNTVFGIKNEIRAHRLENELLTLDPKFFSSIEDFLCKFKTLRLLLERCEVKKKDDALICAIFANLGPAYSLFVSTFHSTREAFISQGSKYKTPSFDAFSDSLIREQENSYTLDLLALLALLTKF